MAEFTRLDKLQDDDLIDEGEGAIAAYNQGFGEVQNFLEAALRRWLKYKDDDPDQAEDWENRVGLVMKKIKIPAELRTQWSPMMIGAGMGEVQQARILGIGRATAHRDRVKLATSSPGEVPETRIDAKGREMPTKYKPRKSAEEAIQGELIEMPKSSEEQLGELERCIEDVLNSISQLDILTDRYPDALPKMRVRFKKELPKLEKATAQIHAKLMRIP